MEEFLKQVSLRDDVWYATNIEIKDYITAYRNLKVSVAQDKIYNPSATTVCIKSGDEIININPGEVLKL